MVSCEFGWVLVLCVVGGLVGCVACGMLVFGFGDVFVFVIWVVLSVI